MNKNTIISAILTCCLTFGITALSAPASPSPSSASAAPLSSSAPTASPTVPSSQSPSAVSPSPSSSARIESQSSAASPSPSVSPMTSASPISGADKTGEENQVDKNAQDKDSAPTEFPDPKAAAAIVIDRKTGDILYEKNKSEKLYPASTTKIMTAILALENGTLSDFVTATQEAILPITNQHSHMGIKIGETLTLEQLLYGMMVYSANDAANVIAVHIGGSLEGFVNMMNGRAAELGLNHTHYQNAHGFHDDNHYTTAEDLAVLTKYAMQNDKFCEIVKTVLYRIPANDYYTQERVLSTTNHLISRYRDTRYLYKYAIGVKTGYTEQAGNCLVSAATKNNIELITVLLKAENGADRTLHAFADSTALYEYAFKNYQYCKIASLTDVVADSAVYEAKGGTRVVLSPAEEIEKLLPISVKTEDIVTEVKMPDKTKAPIAKGDVLGEVQYMYQGRELARTNLIAGNDVEHDKVIAAVHLISAILKNPLFFIPAIIFVIFLISSNAKRRKKRNKRRKQLKYANQIKRK